MAAYLLAEAGVADPLACEIFEPLAPAALAHYGGRYRACGGRIEVLEGGWSTPERLVIVEFDSLEQARKFYHSPEYQAARAARNDAAEMNVLIVEGLPI
ncbi:MAG: DUF1330 domain-containing protein [Candidatus Accumulibacter sp.]|uniref:DUF1330 domain-containing protein n=1 Tax=Accumulibacter sp. TaxID=2053492 RepID=UPI0019E25551|nr:DUF1330 domain-containing protein [Accumulibacter sp.]MBE2258347.1 DUF1330 domain-containing protein [Paracoccaceae bacterium]MCB1940510.1 DUF1330 domain-containing protein [Accumulibacter sp.]MCP5248414.1 DUF1330 domain-containing protein [Accumulibacter sp.]